MKKLLFLILAGLSSVFPSYSQTCNFTGDSVIDITGELRQWHTVVVDVRGPMSDETCSVNPFMDYRFNVRFTHPVSGKSYLRPAYFAADGNAANTSVQSGDVWRCKFRPDEVGTWNYLISFREGNNVAISTSPTAGTSLVDQWGLGNVVLDGLTGSFTVLPSNKTGVDFRAHGRLAYVGERYLQFQGTGEYFIKGGADAPENALAYDDFDNTPNINNRRKSWSAHASDWNTGDPDWQVNKGRELIGALNYLSSKGVNAWSFLTMNINGDDKNVFPYIQNNGSNSPQDDRLRFDVSKLEQWDIVFEHAQSLGIYLHFKTQETENDRLLDGGQLGNERKLYYRELVARFGHHLALNWNLGEENNIWDELNNPNQSIVKSYAQYIRDIDPHDHPIVIHSYIPQKAQVYTPLLGDPNFTGPSMQCNRGDAHQDAITWINSSANAGVPWVVVNDEQGPANYGVPPDDGYNGYNHTTGPSQVAIREDILWGNLMAGGAGVEYYFGYQLPQSDLSCEDWRSRDQMWDYTKYAIDFFKTLPVSDMASADNLVSSGFCFAEVGNIYVVYMEDGNDQPTISLTNSNYVLDWYNPRTGASINGAAITTGGSYTLPNAPNQLTEDWVAKLSPESSLPAQVLDFQVDTSLLGVRTFSWTTQDEVNMDRYEVLNQNNDVVTSHKAFNDVYNQYEAIAVDVSPQYRLKLIDIDGSYDYSNWVYVGSSFEKPYIYSNKYLQLYPETSVKVYTLSGVFLSELSSSSKLDYPSGFYLIKVISRSGTSYQKISIH